MKTRVAVIFAWLSLTLGAAETRTPKQYRDWAAVRDGNGSGGMRGLPHN